MASETKGTKGTNTALTTRVRTHVRVHARAHAFRAADPIYPGRQDDISSQAFVISGRASAWFDAQAKRACLHD